MNKMIFPAIPKRSFPVTLSEFKIIIPAILGLGLADNGAVARFEAVFKDYVGAKEAIAVSSGRTAMLLILKSLGLNIGDRIILSAYNFKGVPDSLREAGFELKFVDADENTYQIKIDEIEKNINGKTRAIIATHLFGQPCDLEGILRIAKKHSLRVIEDAACALGTHYHAGHVGTQADAGFFSFSGGKVLNSYFGGMVVTNDLKVAQDIRKEASNLPVPTRGELLKEGLADYICSLLSNRIIYSFLGYPVTLFLNSLGYDPLEIYKKNRGREITENKMRFSEIQAKIALKRMNRVDSWILQRRKVADRILHNLDPSISRQRFPADSEPNHFMVALKTKDKKAAARELLVRGIDVNLSYAVDCCDEINLSSSKSLSKSLISIHLPLCTEKEADKLCRVLNGLKGFFF